MRARSHPRQTWVSLHPCRCPRANLALALAALTVLLLAVLNFFAVTPFGFVLRVFVASQGSG